MLKENVEMIQALRKCVMNYLEDCNWPIKEIVDAANLVLKWDEDEEKYHNEHMKGIAFTFPNEKDYYELLEQLKNNNFDYEKFILDTTN